MITVAKDDDLYLIVEDKTSDVGQIYDKTRNLISPKMKTAITYKFVYWEDYYLSEKETKKMIATAKEK